MTCLGSQGERYVARLLEVAEMERMMKHGEVTAA